MVTVDSKGRIVLPREVRDRLGIRPGSEVAVTAEDGRANPDRRRESEIEGTGPPRDDDTTIVAHRGHVAEHPENTIAAIVAAASVADAVEIDVRGSAGGEPVVLHDATLRRLTSARGRVAETSSEALADLDVLRSGESIPTLRDVLAALPADLDLVLDLKVPGLAADLVALADEFDHDILVSSAVPHVLREVRDVDSEVPLATILQERLVNRPLRPFVPGLPSWLYAPEDVAGIVESAMALDCEAIHPRYELCLRTDLVSRAHAADLRVVPWTITRRREFEALRAVGGDGVITDVPAELVC